MLVQQVQNNIYNTSFSAKLAPANTIRKITTKLNDTEQIKHRSLTSYLKKDSFHPTHVEKIIELCPQTSRYIGKLPYGWLKNIPIEKRSAYTKEIYDLFADFAQKTSLPNHIDEITLTPIIENFAQKLSTHLNQNIEVTFLGKGEYGRTFKIKNNNEKFVVKTFFPDVYYSIPHGRGAEICNASFASKHAVKGAYADFYFGKFARCDDKDGFIVTKFIDFKNARMGRVKNDDLNLLMNDKVICDDRYNMNNCILDTIIDYGDVSASRWYENYNAKQYKIERLLKEAISTSNKSKYEDILERFKGTDLDYVLRNVKEDFLKYSKLFESECHLGIYKKPSNPIAYKIIKSDIHNKIFRLLHRTILTDNKSEYDAIINHYKDTKVLNEILQFYNYKLEPDMQKDFIQQLGYVEKKCILDTLKDFSLL